MSHAAEFFGVDISDRRMGGGRFALEERMFSR